MENFYLPKKVIFYVAGAIIFLVFFYFLFLSAPNNFPVGTVINIKDGSSLKYVAKYFEESHIIRSKIVFETFAVILGGERNIISGDYLFEKKLPIFEIAWRVARGERHLAPVKVTIPEGFNVSDIAKAFALKLTNFKEAKFLSEATVQEGCLFPDTYFFLTTDNEENVLQAMSDNFQKKIFSLLPQITSSGRTEKEIIIMASLIEKEAEGDADREFISGILWKRIALNMPLQVNADLATYKTKGLPESPICNPGLKAIEAAIHPKTSSYLYYLHDKNGNIHYASTFAGHILNEQKYLK